MRDLFNNVKVAHLLSAKDITDHTDVGTDYVDLQGFEAAAFLVNIGSVTNQDVSNKMLPVLQECDSAPGTNSSWAAVDSGNILGAFTVCDTATTDEDLTQIVSYIGTKRYVRVWLNFTSAGSYPDHFLLSVDAILANARHQPASALTVTTGASTG